MLSTYSDYPSIACHAWSAGNCQSGLAVKIFQITLPVMAGPFAIGQFKNHFTMTVAYKRRYTSLK